MRPETCKKAIFIVVSLLWTLFILTGCSSGTDDADLASYKANMEQFFTNVETIDNAINGLDPMEDGSERKLLEYLDALELTFSQMASLEVPEVFAGVPEYAQDASDCMKQAVSYYHDAYEGEFNASYADAAFQYYERANTDVKEIIKILHGDVSYSKDDSAEDTDTDSETEEE